MLCPSIGFSAVMACCTRALLALYLNLSCCHCSAACAGKAFLSPFQAAASLQVKVCSVTLQGLQCGSSTACSQIPCSGKSCLGITWRSLVKLVTYPIQHSRREELLPKRFAERHQEAQM